MRRRDFIGLLSAAALVGPTTSLAQTPDRPRRVGVLIGVAERPEGHARFAALRRGLEAFGWVEGQNIEVVVRFRDDSPKPLSAYAQELAALTPDLLVANTGPAVTAILRASSSIPIIFVQVPDPVAQGFVTSLSQPGGRLTGFSSSDQAMGGKWLELLKEIAPRLTQVSLLGDPRGGALATFRPSIEVVAKGSQVILRQHLAQDDTGISRVFDGIAGDTDHGLIVLPTTSASTYVRLITDLATKHRIPAMYPYPYFVTAGGLISYGIDNLDLYVQAASYVDRILRGAEPADLPVQAPSKFQLSINRMTADTLGLAIPPSLLARADEVIE
jgi:putative tryptophan/tyrosine transport system substrate-binding protein